MDYDKKIKDKIDKLSEIAEENDRDILQMDSDFITQIRKLPEGDIKAKLNEYRNRIKACAKSSGDPAKEVKKILNELKEYSINLNNAS